MLSLLPLVCGLQVCSRSQVACLTPQFGLRVPVSVAAAIYERAEGDTGEVDVARVNELLEERAELREARDFAAADEVRDELKEMGVTILDRDQKWFFGDRPASFGDKNTYTRQAGDTSEIDVEKVEELLQERNFLRRNREFDAADEVRNKLNDMGVRVLDREQEWFVWRKRRPMGAPRDFGPLGHDYTRANDDKSELSEEVLGEINELLRKRLEAKMSRRFEEADGYYSELKDKYNVNVYDGKKKSWRADGGKWTAPGYARAQGDEGEVADLEAVLAVVNERAAARRKRDYTEADRLRGQLQDMGIYVDDKERTWSTGK